MGASVSVAQGAPLDAGTYKADEAAVERFCELLRIPTVSRENIAERDDEPFNQWIPTLQRLYPHFFKVAELTRVGDIGMLLRWPGADSALDPIVMMAHQDVVPVEGQDWKHDPFGAEIIDGEIWARGSLDTKCIVSAFLEAAEHLIDQGFVPPRDVWFFSSDGEEIAAPTATHAVQWLREHNIHPYMVLDEGGAVATDAPLGVTEPVAMVGVSEKGHVDLTVTARADGGHASTPAANDACRLLCRVCETISANPGKPQLTPAVEATLTELGARSSATYQAIFGNLWLTRPAVTKIMAASPETSAMLRTTYALTQLEGSNAHNVLPPVARANFNVRIAPFETIADAAERARKLAAQQCRASGVSPDHVTVEINEAIPLHRARAHLALRRRCRLQLHPSLRVGRLSRGRLCSLRAELLHRLARVQRDLRSRLPLLRLYLLGRGAQAHPCRQRTHRRRRLQAWHRILCGVSRQP